MTGHKAQHAWMCLTLGALLTVTGCNRAKSMPAGESQAATPVQTTNTPTSVKGCLRAGDAAGTYVLTADRTTTGEQTATYQLQAAANVPLADHVGKQVEVSGVITTQQEVTTRTTPQAAKPAETAATTGRPTVSTATELDVRRMEVHQVRHLSANCVEER